MAMNPKIIDGSCSVITWDIDSPNPHMATILEDLYEGDATNIAENLKNVRWMTDEQAFAFSMYFGSTLFDGDHHFGYFNFQGSHNGRGNKKKPSTEEVSLDRGRYLHELWLSHQAVGEKISLEALYFEALENWPKKRLGIRFSTRTLRNDLARYRRKLKKV